MQHKTHLERTIMTGLAFKPLHPTFGAEVIGADFSNPSVDLVENLKKALAKVSRAGEGVGKGNSD